MDVKKVSIIGCGFVGRACGAALADKHIVTMYDISPIIRDELKRSERPWLVTSDRDEAYKSADYIFICVPTDSCLGSLDTEGINGILRDLSRENSQADIIIRSTVPIGYSEAVADRCPGLKISFVPEFLREGSEYEDVKNPDRVVIGGPVPSDIFNDMVVNGAPVLRVSRTEAEAIKLLSNTYLAGRVAFFNEIDSICNNMRIDSGRVIGGICADKRIGDIYNNPSFGYGGYCLPKDAQAAAGTPGAGPLLKSIPGSNAWRKAGLIQDLKKKTVGKKVGFYRVGMKTGSTNSRCSAVLDIIEAFPGALIYDPDTCGAGIYGRSITNNLAHFLKHTDFIIANRYHTDLDNFTGVVFTRDLYRRD